MPPKAGSCNPRAFLLKRRAPHQARASSTGLVLGIESSCDDTGVAILRGSDGEILGHSIASQVVIL